VEAPRAEHLFEGVLELEKNANPRGLDSPTWLGRENRPQEPSLLSSPPECLLFVGLGQGVVVDDVGRDGRGEVPPLWAAGSTSGEWISHRPETGLRARPDAACRRPSQSENKEGKGFAPTARARP